MRLLERELPLAALAAALVAAVAGPAAAFAVNYPLPIDPGTGGW
jgi:hypothetical protein